MQSSLDCLILLGATSSEFENAIEKSKRSRDIIKIQFLELLQHAAECQLGTDAVGLVPKLGLSLLAAALIPFCPKK
ncbi:MAG: DUF2110 family protein [Candidatus Bathyarchaeia archaeon]